MNRIWSFSPSSEVYLERILQYAPGAADNSKWLRLFPNPDNLCAIIPNCEGKLSYQAETNSENTNILTNQDMEVEEAVEIDSNCEENNKILIEFLDSEETGNFEEIINKCRFNNISVKKLIDSMTEKAAEKFYKLIDNTDSLNTDFIQSFFAIFLPQFLKLKQTRLHLDILTMSYKKYTLEFQSIFLPVALQIITPLHILNDFAKSLNENEKTDLLSSLITINLNCNEFTNNIDTILTLYNGAVKSDNIQKYILKCLVENSETASSNKMFGRLLYSYLSSLNVKPADLSTLESIIENHRSPMKRPCMSVFRKLL